MTRKTGLCTVYDDDSIRPDDCRKHPVMLSLSEGSLDPFYVVVVSPGCRLFQEHGNEIIPQLMGLPDVNGIVASVYRGKRASGA